MAKFLWRFFPGLWAHLTDDQLVGLEGESASALQGLMGRLHLSFCQLCRMRRQEIESRAEQLFARLQYHIYRQDGPAPADDTNEFAARVDALLADFVPPRRRSFRWPMIFLPELPSFNPALAVGVLFGLAKLASLYVWKEQRV